MNPRQNREANPVKPVTFSEFELRDLRPFRGDNMTVTAHVEGVDGKDYMLSIYLDPRGGSVGWEHNRGYIKGTVAMADAKLIEQYNLRRGQAVDANFDTVAGKNNKIRGQIEFGSYDETTNTEPRR